MTALARETASSSKPSGSLRIYSYILYLGLAALVASTILAMTWLRRGHQSTTQRLGNYHLMTMTSAAVIREELDLIERELVFEDHETRAPGSVTGAPPSLIDRTGIAASLYVADAELASIVESQSTFGAGEFEQLVSRIEGQLQALEVLLASDLRAPSEVAASRQQLAGLDLSLDQLILLHRSEHTALSEAFRERDSQRLLLFAAIIAVLLFTSYAVIRYVLTRAQRAVDDLQESEAFTRTVMDHLPIGLAVNSVEPTVEFTYINDNFARFYRTTREALTDSDAFWEVVYEDPAFREQIRQRVLEDCASGDNERMRWEEVPIARQGRDTAFINARNTPVPGQKMMISTVWDVSEKVRLETERAELEEQYRQSLKMESIGRLAGGIAHDLNNLLTPILGYSELLLDELKPGDGRRESLHEIQRAGHRARDLVRQLLAFGRKQTLVYQPVDLNRAVSGFEELLRHAIREDILIEFIPSVDECTVLADIGQVEQVLMNLAVNAQDAMPDGGRLKIETARIDVDEAGAHRYAGMDPGTYVELSVSDTGVGMSSEIQAHLFEPFFSTKGAAGTGLGLATVYGIVKQHGGEIQVHSRPGSGSTFQIYLPAADGEQLQDEARPQAVMGKSGSETVLLVEDSAQVRLLAESVLERQGYTVLSADSGSEALKILASHDGPVHLLLTDVVMPGMNGKELYAKAAEQYPELKVIYMSGYTDDVLAGRQADDSDLAFVQKPFSVDGLATKLREVLDADSEA